ncbi:MAG: hypothetical protein ABSB35_10165 [Bryobacteraceae bacterium]
MPHRSGEGEYEAGDPDYVGRPPGPRPTPSSAFFVDQKSRNPRIEPGPGADEGVRPTHAVKTPGNRADMGEVLLTTCETQSLDPVPAACLKSTVLVVDDDESFR